MKVLIIEDDSAVLRSLVRVLSKQHDVETAVNASDASARIRESRPDVIVCDLHLGGPSGLTLHAALQRDEPELARRFVFITGSPQLCGSVSCMTNECLEKPFRIEALVDAMERVAVAGRVSS